MRSEDTAVIERGIKAYEDATRCHVTSWRWDDENSTLSVNFLPLAPEETITVQDVLSGIEESEEWFAHNYD